MLVIQSDGFKCHLQQTILYRLLIGIIRLKLTWEQIENRLYMVGNQAKYSTLIILGLLIMSNILALLLKIILVLLNLEPFLEKS